MNKCQRYQSILSDYRTGLLSGKQLTDLERHLVECRECAAELKLLDGVLALLEESTVELEPPAGLWNGVINSINDPASERRGFLPVLLGWVVRPVHAAGLGLAALAVAGAIYVGVPQQGPAENVVLSASNEYTQGHALYASQSSVADRAAYLTLVTASSDTGVTR